MIVHPGSTGRPEGAAARLLCVSLSLAGCGAPPTETATPALAPTAVATASFTATATAGPEPSPTPTPALLDLQILEWFEHAVPNLEDPSIQDTQVEILVHNPNDSPVYVNTTEMEFRLLNAAGEVVFTSGHGYFSLWSGTWMLAGESTGFQICACFETQGFERRAWESIALVAPLEPAPDVAYTTDVEATLGEPFSLAEAHLGGSGTGIPITLTNNGDRPLANMPMRVIARDAAGRYIGMAGFGNSVVSFTEDVDIQPGDSLYGVLDSEIDYYDGPLTYEIVAIGIPARGASATEEAALPSGTPLAEWEGIPIMPGAIGGDPVAGGYQFTIRTGLEQVMGFYERELASRGYRTAVETAAGYSALYFRDGNVNGAILMTPVGEILGVAITIGE